MKSLEELLNDNYQKLKDPICERLVIKFVRKNENVEDKDPLFIKKLTKVISHVLERDPSSLQPYLERIYQFHKTGIEKVQSGELGVGEGKDEVFIEAHLYGYAADIAKRLFRKTNKRMWLEKAWQQRRLAADAIQDYSYEESEIYRGYAADDARTLFRLNEEVEWGSEAYEELMRIAQHYANKDRSLSGKLYNDAGNVAWEMASKEDRVSWLKRSLEAKKKSLELMEKDPKWYERMVKITLGLFHYTEEERYAEEAYQFLKKRYELDPTKSAKVRRTYSLGKIIKTVQEISKNSVWETRLEELNSQL